MPFETPIDNELSDHGWRRIGEPGEYSGLLSIYLECADGLEFMLKQWADGYGLYLRHFGFIVSGNPSAKTVLNVVTTLKSANEA